MTSPLRTLAALGALLTILSLAFEAFAQQVLTIDTLKVGNKTTNAPIAFDAPLPRALNTLGGSPPTPYVPLDFPGAIVSSILNGASPPTGTCPTGNCTWPITPTLGVCSIAAQ